VAAIGTAVSRWITMHGFAFKCVQTGFERIKAPCGISDKPVGSLAEWTQKLIWIR